MNINPLDAVASLANTIVGAVGDYFPSEQKKAEFQALVAKQLGDWQIKMEEIAQAGIASARAMQTATKSKLPPFLASSAVGGFLVCLLIAFFFDLPDKRMNLVMFLLGILTGLVKDVYGFYFGSSADSQRKTEIMGKH